MSITYPDIDTLHSLVRREILVEMNKHSLMCQEQQRQVQNWVVDIIFCVVTGI